MAVIVGYVKCPRCGLVEHVVALEDGVWMCVVCVTEFCHDGFVGAGQHRCESSHSGNISTEKGARNGRNWTL